MIAELQTERKGLEAKREILAEKSERPERTKKAGISLQQLTTAVNQMSFAKKREILKIFIDGTPGTGIFVTPDRRLNIVGTIPLMQQHAVGSEPNTNMLEQPADDALLAQGQCSGDNNCACRQSALKVATSKYRLRRGVPVRRGS